MSWIDRLEKRFGSYALPGITIWILVGQVMVFVSQYVGPMAQAGGAGAVYEVLALDPQQVYDGEWWRLLTYPFLSPMGGAFPILVIFYFLFFYFIGTTLEGAWGTFRYNAYLAIGYVATAVSAFVADAIAPGSGFTTGTYVFGSLFLAFARLYPDFIIHLMLILPIKVKWLAWFQWFSYWMVAIFGSWHERLMSLAAIFNYVVFFGREVFRDAKQNHRRMQHKAKALKSSAAGPVTHECRVCGLTSAMDPKASFRYCSQCAGQCCYCPEHLKDHEHVT